MKRDAGNVLGYLNPDGTGDGNWVRFDPCPSCGQTHGRVSYRPRSNDVEGSPLIEVVLGVLILSALIVGLMAWSWILEAAR